jgi:hypothetical protein
MGRFFVIFAMGNLFAALAFYALGDYARSAAHIGVVIFSVQAAKL